ncbi:MAG: hypothetical protein HYX61_07680 [Gammaproteobacteria bacterium]|jgi:tetratricopeptide (TPR) repeat protein|nr:hypothetical protein [Gammaproteobacteria bacterium]
MKQHSSSVFYFFLLSALFWISYSPLGRTKQSPSDTTKLGAPLFTNLGNSHHPIATQIPLAQRYFDQGLILFYGFDSGESIRSFREAIHLDPNCAMCYWGLALALSSKNNMPLDGHEKQDAFDAIKKAQQHVDPSNVSEKAYIEALSSRLSSVTSSPEKTPENVLVPADVMYCGGGLSTSKEAQDYANAMREVVQQFPKDIDAKNLYVFSLFDVAKWHFWSREGNPYPNTAEIMKTLDSALAMNPKNIAANHYYIHVVEQSPHPEQALPNADFLLNAVPGAEHLVHMPSHIYLLTGRYYDASVANQKANESLKQYEADCLSQGFKPEINYLYYHNLHFLWASSMMDGQSELAFKAAKELARQIPVNSLKNDSYLQMFLPVIYFTQARFGKLDEILKETQPIAESQYAMGMWHYARGVAYTHLNKIKEAKNELAKLQVITQQKPDKGNFEKFGEDDLRIGEQVLSALLADKVGQNEVMIEHWKKAMKLEDNLGYKEPPAWYFPIREAFGNALLKTHNAVEAEAVFKQDLKQYPNNGWALFGLEKSLRAQGKNKEADDAKQSFQKAWDRADITLPIR